MREKARDYAVIAFVVGTAVKVILKLNAVRRRRKALDEQWESLVGTE